MARLQDAPPRQVRACPDIAVAARPLFVQLCEVLRETADGFQSSRHKWGVPELFFFDNTLQRELQTERSESNRADVRSKLVELTDDALTVLAASVDARHAARAIPDFPALAAALAPHHPRARMLADLLALIDDEVIRVIVPASRTGFRVRTRGIADIAQFHILLANCITGNPANGLLPGPRPDLRVVDACSNGPENPDAVATARFQFHRPEALRPDGTLPFGLVGTDHWFWPNEPLHRIPRVAGERTVLLGEPAFRNTWNAARKLPHVNADLELLEVMDALAVTEWIEGQTGTELPVLLTKRRAA